ncbi:hypothetical protein BJ508DRAFT_335248 [Ascobolus immersus RN42]|uniref:Uncharacterized protein n=1 Tax=Ascobolus immersus RN42 TaxID=1160509 RepID=A0A3N4HD23_ASCIM|nr:hypothetical protein BJ508DRAFT_335248 [Ascobolus immersus RN42]
MLQATTRTLARCKPARSDASTTSTNFQHSSWWELDYFFSASSRVLDLPLSSIIIIIIITIIITTTTLPSPPPQERQFPAALITSRATSSSIVHTLKNHIQATKDADFSPAFNTPKTLSSLCFHALKTIDFR